MNRIEKLLSKYSSVEVEFEAIKSRLGGLTIGNHIIINSNATEPEQFEWLLEEIGHHETSVGNISNYDSLENMKQEKSARQWGYKHFLSRKDIERLRSEHPDNDYEIADELGVQVPYLHEVGITYGLDFKHVKD